MNELNIVDDRTIEQVREDGDDRWPSGEPYILRGVCCVCGANVAQEVENGYPVHVCLIHLDTPVPCELHLLVQEEQKCTGLAHWVAGTEHLYAECDECILNCVEQLPDNRKWLEPALADIQARREEQHERRRLFFAAMRHPEMQILRHALRHLRDDRGYDWRQVSEIEQYRYSDGCWVASTDKCVIYCLWVDDPGLCYEDFSSVDHHDENNPYCECYYCFDATLKKRELEIVAGIV